MYRFYSLLAVILLLTGCAWTNKFELPTLAHAKSVLAAIDEEDHKHFDRALNYTGEDNNYTWYNRRSQITYRIRPQQRYFPLSESIEAQPCRVYYLIAQHGSFARELHRSACRRADKTWDLTAAVR